MAPQTILAWTPFDPWHMLVLLAVALLLFGKRLPEVGRSLGRGISEFKKGLRDVKDELEREEPEVHEPPKAKLQPPARAVRGSEDDRDDEDDDKRQSPAPGAARSGESESQPAESAESRERGNL